MKIGNLLALLLLVFFAGCATIQSAGDLQYGRQALLAGNNEAALGYFSSAAKLDPNYIYATGSSPKQSVWSYVGRSEYLTGRFPQARQTLERALASNRDEDIARLYLGLTLGFNIGQFWDVDRDIRRAIQSDLAMISGKDLDWQRLTADTEWLGIRMEWESDWARRQEVNENSRDSDGRNP